MPSFRQGLHQPEHGVACDAAIADHGAAGDLSLGDEAAQIVLRGIGVQCGSVPFQQANRQSSKQKSLFA